MTETMIEIVSDYKRVMAVNVVAIGRVLLTCLVIIAVTAWGKAQAEPLDKAVCLGLRKEKSALVSQGLEKTMARGPEWVEANLDAQTFDQIKRFIHIEELILFRCPATKKRAAKKKKSTKKKAGQKKKTIARQKKK